MKEYKSTKEIRREVFENENIPKESILKQALISFAMDLPIEELKKIFHLEVIDESKCHELIKSSKTQTDYDYWRFVLDKINYNKTIELRMKYFETIQLDTSNIDWGFINENETKSKN